MADRPRIVIALPEFTESTTVSDWLLTEGFEPVRRSSLKAASEEMNARAFDLLIADGTFVLRDGLRAGSLARNPLTPIVVIGDSVATGSDAARRRAMYLGRPLDRALLVCSVSMAVLDGRPIRRSERKPVNRFNAVVNGIPSYLVDVSNEGLRFEMPEGRRLVPPPYFTVRVPLIGIAVVVQRMWVRSWPGERAAGIMRCGAALTQNKKATEKAWRTFVDTMPAAIAGEPSSAVLQFG